ncbi:MAG: ABC transporter ATP-binding protein, partial [Candidatus Limnocylindrales bacterium]
TAFARAVAVEPSVLLLDEPLSAVDAKVREELRTEIRRMQLRLGITAILVTHDQSEALSISDRVVVMSRGRIEEVGTPSQIYAEPRSEFTASFIGAMNEFPVRIVSRPAGLVERDGVRFEAPGADELPEGSEALLLVRPESLEPVEVGASASGPVIRGMVEVQTFLGSQTRLLVREGTEVDTSVHGSRLVSVDVPSATAGRWPPGTEIAVSFPTKATRIIAARVSGTGSTGSSGSAAQHGG